MILYVGTANLIIYGVMNVVITDTATTMGYRKLLVTCRLTPSDAMMKANSPICVKLKPLCMAILSGWPDSNTPKVPNMVCPKITAMTNAIIG